MTRPNWHSRKPAAFTLVELMISIALVLLLVIGINQVFSLTSKTVGAGQASSAAQRDMRAASKVMADDFANALTSNGPFFMIYSRQTYAFRNKQDQLTDRDYASATTVAQQQAATATQDLQNLGTESQIPVPVVNNRSHRVDMVRFFARGDYHRQTGNPGSLVSTTSSNEAYITYGHGQIPTVTTTVAAPTNINLPGAGTQTTNPNNFYASQWALARSAILLKGVTAPENAYSKPAGTPPSPPNLTPITLGTLPSGTTQTNLPIQASRFDLATGTIDSIGADLAQRIRFGSGTSPNIWYRRPNPAPAGFPYPATSTTDLLYRMQVNPFITRPITDQNFAVTAPFFVGGCSQFIVEYAGDFISQINDSTLATYGQIKPTNGDQPDGVLDYYIPQSGPNAYTRQIRWYGFPRDVDGSGIVKGFPTGLNGANELTNVVPLRDVLATGGYLPASFEKEVNPVPATPPAQPPSNVVLGIPKLSGGTKTNYEGTATSGDYGDTLTAVTNTSMPAGCSYLCLWEFGGPQMIRITMTLDDPNGRLNDGATFEYVFTLKK